MSGFLASNNGLVGEVSTASGIVLPTAERNWYAVSTVPQNENRWYGISIYGRWSPFLPTYETVRVWKNRQRMKIVLPLFPTYLFVHIDRSERVKVLRSPGVLRIVGNGREYIPLPDAEIEFFRSGFYRDRLEPFRELVIGEKVRIKSGVMQGVQGTLVRKNDNLKFVITLELINQHAAMQVAAEDLEPVKA